MSSQLEQIFARLRGSADFEGVDFSDINACGIDGDNALHCVVRRGDIAAAKILISAGIDVNKAGDRSYTPLHVACMNGNVEMVKLLVDNGADLFAFNEGDLPFMTARIAGHDQICDFLAPLMQKLQSGDSQIWVRARIAQLRREIARLEASLEGK